MKKILTRLSSILLLVTIVISAISMSGHVFAQTDIQNQNSIVDVETDDSEEFFELTTDTPTPADSAESNNESTSTIDENSEIANSLIGSVPVNENQAETTDNDTEATASDVAETENSAVQPIAVGTGENSYTVTYDAGDGQFDDGSKTNTVTYTVKSDPVVKYSHTDNVDDTGKQNGNYGNSEKKTEVVTIPGADKLTVTVTYGGEGERWDYVSIFSGSHPGYTAAYDYTKADIVQRLGGGKHAGQTKTYTVQGDSVTFAWKSDSSGCGDGYGYYATVTYSGKTISGGYKRPTAPERKKLNGWATTQNGAVFYPKAGIPDTEKITSNITIYAVYSDFQWYDDWNYTLDDVNHTILLKKYNGDETVYEIPAKASIEGINYTTVIGRTGNSFTQLDTGVISNLSFQNGVQTNSSFYGLFRNNTTIQSIDFNGVDTSQVTDMSSMFNGCNKLTSLNISHLNTFKVTDMCLMFSECSSLTSLDVSNFDTSKVTNMSYMFNSCGKLTSLDVSHFDTSKVTAMAYMFYGCSKLTSLDVSHFDTSEVTSMLSMFYGCSTLATLDVSHFDTSKVTNMAYMFYGCGKLTSLDVSHFDTSQVTGMYSMFNGCSSLTSLDVSHFDTSQVTGMYSMFNSCSSLTSLDVSNFDASKVTDMSQMFSNCRSLTSLDVSHFDTSKVTDMSFMFYVCSSLTSLDVSHFDTSKVTNMRYMFYRCSSLTSLDVFADQNTFTAIKGSSSTNDGYTAVSSKLSRIRLHKGNGNGDSSKLCAFVQQSENKTVDGYTGNWTAFSEYNHANGSELTPDINSKYSSLQNAYNSITDEQWAENPDGIWFVWEKPGDAQKKYTITIHPNNGTLNVSDGNIKKNGDGSVTVTVTYNSTNFYALGVSANRTGYTATGLYTATSGGTKLWNNGGNCLKDGTYWSSSNTWIHAGNIDLYPQWKANTYTVSYNGNGATGGSTANSSHTYDSAKALTANGYRKNGYSFAGWTTNADGSGTVYSNGTSVKNLTSANGGTVTLYAKWNAKSGTINYIAGNGGTLNRGAETVTGTNKAVGATATPKAGYSFDGWYGDSGEKISSAATFVPGTPTAFNGFGGNYYGGSVAYDATNKWYSVTANAASMNDSWGSGTSFAESDDIPYGKWYIASFEIWSPVDATVILDVNDYARGTSWSGNDNDANRKQSGFGSLTAGTWKKVMFAYQNANTKNSEKIAIYDNSGIGIKYDTANGNQTFRIRNVQTMIADSYLGSSDRYTAKFSINNYSISYDLGGGSVTGNPASYTVETADFTLKNPTSTGHTFTGWSGTGISGTSTDVKVPKGSTGNRSYKANWSVNNYTLDLNGILDGSSNGGIAGYGTADVYINGVLKADDVSDFCQGIPYGSTYEIKDIKATAGHVYAGTDQTLKGTMGASRVNIALKFNTKKTTVNFMRNYNNSDTTKSSETYTYGKESQKFSDRGYSRTGYTLLGWAESQAATKETYSVNCGVASSWIDAHYPSINLYAVWSKNSYKISYSLNGGSVSGNPETYQVDTADITLKNPSRTGYTFLGWSGTGITGTSKEVKIPKGSTENRSYTANWKINQYDIVIKGDKGTESITYGGKTYPLDATNSVTIHADYGTNTPVTYKVKKGFHIVSETGTSMSNTQQTWTNNAGKEGSTGGQSWTTCAFARTITVNTVANKFVLSFGDGNGGTSGSQNATFGNGEKVTFNAEKKPGYTFKNWNTKPDGTGKSYPDGVSIDKIDASNGSTVTLYPIYRPNVLTFHFYANGADTYRSTPDEKTHNVAADEKANKTEIALTQNVECMKYDASVQEWGLVNSERLSKTGYTSTNKWHADSVRGALLDANNGVYAKTQDIAEAAGILQQLENGDTDIKLYADWLANTYTVKFDANGGTGNPITQKMTYDKDTAFTPVSYTRTKHRFLYWTENADGSGQKYTDKASVKNLTATANGTVTLYAQWEKLTDLKIGVTVSGNMGSRVKDFEFFTTFPACFQNKTFTIIKADGSKETVTIGADGVMKFSLKHGETFTVTDLDTEQVNAIKNFTDRCIDELDYRTEGYTTTHAASVESDGTLRVDFNNAKSSGVPTGIHNSSGTMWMMIFGFVGMIFAISSFFRKKHQKKS